MRWKFLLPVLLFFSSVSFSETNPPTGASQEIQVKDLSRGVYSYPSANVIPDNAAAYIQNFYTDVQPVALERNGYVKRDSTALGGTKSVTGLWRFLDNSGNEWIISYSSNTFYKNKVSGTPTAFGPITATSQVPVAAINSGKIAFVDGTDSLWWFDGTSTGTVASAPKGKLIAPWRTRFVIGNVTGALTTLYYSGDDDITNWTIGGNPTDPFTRTIGGANNGLYIRCLYGTYQDALIIGTQYNLWAQSGTDQSDDVIRNISSEIGCVENASMREFDGSLMFLSHRGIEEMQGFSIQYISEPIRDLTDVLVKNTSSEHFNIQTTQVDWSAGTEDAVVFVDTETVPGNLQFTFPDTFDAFRNGTASTKQVWTSFDAGTITGSNYVVSNGQFVMSDTGAGGSATDSINIRTYNRLPTFAAGTTYHFELDAFSQDSCFPSVCKNLYVTISTTATTSINPANTSAFVNYFQFNMVSTTTSKVYIRGIKDNVDGALGTVSGDFSFPCTVDLYLATTTYNFTVNSVSKLSGTHSWPSSGVYVYFSGIDTFGGAVSATMDNFSVLPETFTYTSQSLNTGSLISAWGPVSINGTQPSGGNITYQFGSTNTATTNITYASILNGAVPSVATNTYAAFKLVFNQTSGSSPGYVSDFTTSWNEGTAPPLVSTVYDRRYWLSFTTNTASAATNDTVLVYQRNHTFTLLKGINAGSFAVWRDYLYFGNSNATGYVYQFDQGNNDDGSDITSKIITKSYDGGFSSREKDLRNLFVEYLGSSTYTGSVSVLYDLDRSGNAFSLGSANLNEESGQVTAKFPFSFQNPTHGQEFQFTFTKTGTATRLKLYDYIVRYSVKEEK